MMRHGFLTGVMCAAAVLLALSMPAQAKPLLPKPVVAVLDFDAKSADVSKQAASAPDKLSKALSREGKVKKVVDRSLVKKALEQAKEGPDNTRAERVGKAVGADVVVEGQVERLDKKLLVTCRVTDLRTKSVGAQVAKGPAEGHLDETMQEMSDKIGRSFAQASDDSAPQSPPAPPAPPVGEVHQ